MTASEARIRLPKFIDGNAVIEDYAEYEDVIDTVYDALNLLDLKAEGRIIELPVPIGTKVWLATADEAYAHRIDGSEIMLLLDWWGDKMFATKEKAEARLAELRGE